jgi:elongation factor P
MGNINAGNATKGMYLMFKDAPNQVQKAEFMAPGKGSPIMRIKFKNVQTGSVQEFTYKTNESIEEADVDKKEMQYLYRDGDEVVFMDPKTFEQASVPVSLVENQVGFLIADMKCYVLWYAEKAIGVILPPHVSLKVIESPGSVAGNTVNAPKKLVKLETGVEVQVPLFIKEGEMITLDTTTGEYLSRTN